MPIVLLRLLPLAAGPQSRPRQCPLCGSPVLQSWGQSQRRVHDASQLVANVGRFQCGRCGHTFRHYPDGIDNGSHSLRVRRLGAIAWVLGLSFREVAGILKEWGVEVSHTTIWREGHALLLQVRSQQHSPLARYAIDREFVRLASPRLGVVVAVDFGDGHPDVLGTINSGNAREVTAWLKTLVGDSGIEVHLTRTGILDSP